MQLSFPTESGIQRNRYIANPTVASLSGLYIKYSAAFGALEVTRVPLIHSVAVSIVRHFVTVTSSGGCPLFSSLDKTQKLWDLL
jgi:hypothetical protein